MLGLTPQGSGGLELSSEPLGRGGEGSVYGVKNHSIPGLPPAHELVAKLYHDPTAEQRKEKLRAMVEAPVSDPSVAWPLALVFNDSKQFQGYLMQKLDSKSNKEWLYLANTKERNKIAPKFDTRYALMAIRNTAAAILSVHSMGHIIADVNESNIFIKADASVLIVDTDSMQVKASDGTVYRCAVGKQEYTAPELTHGSLRDHERTEATDAFAFAVASYQLITGGATPHQGSFDPHSPEDPPSTVERIRKGILPSLKPAEAAAYGFRPRPGVPIDAVPGFLREHMIAFLSVNPAERLTARYSLETLVKAIDAYGPRLVQCSKFSLHWHEQEQPCAWCSAAAVSGLDPWAPQVAKTAPKQLALPPIHYQEEGSSSARPQRAAPAVAGQQAHAANSAASGASGAGLTQQQAIAALAASNPTIHAALAAASAAAQAAATQQQARQRPKKIKGKVTVEYADGTWGIRPPLPVMWRQSPKLAIWAVKEETWGILKFWWPQERKLPHTAAVIMGYLLGLVAVYSTFATSFSFLTAITTPGEVALASDWRFYTALAPTVTAFAAVTWLLVSALRRASTNLTIVETPVLTVIRFITLAVYYGIPFVAMTFIRGVATIFSGGKRP